VVGDLKHKAAAIASSLHHREASLHLQLVLLQTAGKDHLGP
jgi:hypothetical protein